MGLGLDFNEDLMTQLAQKSGGNHVFIEQAGDLVRIFNYEFNDVLSVVAQEIAIEIRVSPGVRPVRVLNMDAEINGQQVIAKMNQLYSEQEKYLMLEVEVPATDAGQTRKVALVQVSYANLETKTTDRLSSTVSVNFSELLAVVEQQANARVCAEYVLQVSNEQSKLATVLRDKGDIAAARRVLLQNSAFLETNAKKYNVEILRLRCDDNRRQASQLDSPQWNKVRKLMRQQQYADSVQQRFDGSKVKVKKK